MKATVLVIDDEESIRSSFVYFLTEAGYAVDSAANFKEGMAKIAERSFDLVFADIILGGETGIDVLRGIKERDLACPVVLITGYPKIETAADALRLGAFDYLLKPVRKDALLQVTEAALLHKSVMDSKDRVRSNLEAIVNTLRDVLLMVDQDLELTEFNQAGQEVLGLTRDDLGKPLRIFRNKTRERLVAALSKAIQQGKPVELRHIDFLRQGGPQGPVSVSVSPVVRPNGAITGAIVQLRYDPAPIDRRTEAPQWSPFHKIVGNSPKMQRIYALVEDLANVRTSVLITGESGTGKELLAEAIHYSGQRKNKPLVKVNCSALSESLLESELFGHVRGAFTGAIKDKIGRFQLADGGTILLDEIGDISPAIQQRLLRVLQEAELERVGDSRPIKLDVRIIAATNKNLRELVRLGEFRADLYYRLKVVEVCLPPLRERKEDIPLLVDHFIGKFNGKLHKKIETISDDVMDVLMKHGWPGNVRELAHALEHAFVLCHGRLINLDHLPADFMRPVGKTRALSPVQIKKQKERREILRALLEAGGNRSMAARILGVSRRTVHRKIVQHGITEEDERQEV